MISIEYDIDYLRKPYVPCDTTDRCVVRGLLWVTGKPI